MPRSESQNERMRAATQTAVLDTALRLFAQNGYAHTTTRAIAREAGISTGLMYHYFDGKEGLLRAVFDLCLTRIGDTFTRVIRDSPPPRRLAALLGAIFDLLAADTPFWSLFYMLRSQPAILRELGDDFRLWTGRLRAIFESELARDGRAQPALEALLLYSLVEGTIQQYLLDPATYPLERVVATIISRYSAADGD